MRRPLLVPLLALALLAAGCIRPGGGDAGEGPRIGFRGTFTREATDEDARAVCDAAGTSRAECGFMESDPLQYAFHYPTRDECERARARVLQVPHVTGVSACSEDPWAGRKQVRTPATTA